MASLRTHYGVQLNDGTVVAGCGRIKIKRDLNLDKDAGWVDCDDCLELVRVPMWLRRQCEFLQERHDKAQLAKTLCTNCHNPIRVQIFKGTPYCSVDCEKEAKGA